MKKLPSIIPLLMIMLAGCTEFEEPTGTEKENYSNQRTRSSTQYQINLNNPYSLQNVQEALDIVVGPNAPHLTATHHYVRFLPQDSTDMYILIDSLDLDIFPYPFDYDLTLAEMDTHENTLINGYAWQYCLVEPTFQLPTEMAVELLDYAYLQSDEPEMTRAGEQLDPLVYGAAIDKAMEIAGYTIEPQTRASAWQPSATITYNSDEPGESELKLQNVRVRANTTFNSGEGYTDANGNVTISRGWGGKFKNATQYRIIWSTDKWKIRDRGTGKAKYEGPKQKGHWKFPISGDNETAMHATIHRALNAYYYENHPLATGLVKNNGLNVRALWNQHDPDGKSSGYFYWIILGLNVNDIYIYSDYPIAPYSRFSKSDMFFTTFHELGHASHFQAVINTSGMNRVTHYKNAAGIVKESWANGVGYVYMESFYSPYIHTYSSSGDYTAIVESLIHQGFTLQQLQGTVVGKTEWEHWRTAVKALGKIPNVITDMLFDNPNIPVRVNMANLITGPNSCKINTATALTVPNYYELPTGVTFDEWTVTGGTFTTVGGMKSPNLNITFTSGGVFTIKATFILPGDVSYSITKSVGVTTPPPPPPPIVLQTPVIKESGTTGIFGLDGEVSVDNVPPVTPSRASVYVTNSQSVTYEWRVNDMIVGTHWGSSYSTARPEEPDVYRVTCRAYHDGEVTGWSNTVNIYPYERSAIVPDPLIPIPPIDSLDPIIIGKPIEIIMP